MFVGCCCRLLFMIPSFVSGASSRFSSEMPPSKQVNGHSFTTCLIVWGSPQSQSGEAMYPTHACCCGMVPRSFGTCLAGSIGHGAGPFPVAGW